LRTRRTLALLAGLLLTQLPLGAAQDLPVPFLSQRNPAWSGNTLGTCPNPPNTVGDYGCFTTSKAMVFNYHQPAFTDPGALNACLTSSGGYSSGCLANWSQANACAPSGVAYLGEEAGSVATLAASIDAQLAAGYPVLADVRYNNNSCAGSTGQHMVVIVGKNGSTYAIKDPWATADTYRTLNTPALGSAAYVLCKIRKYQGPAASRQVVVSGDWNGDGRDGAWTFTSGWWAIPASDGGVSFAFGQPGDLPVVGDWDGDGEDDIGVFRPGSTPSTFYLDTNRDRVTDWTLPLAGHYPDDKPIAGDWDADGDDDIGAWNAANGWFYRFRVTSASSWQDVDSFQMGLPTDAPLAGNWDGVGGDEVGVFRRGEPVNTNNFHFRKADGSVVSLLDKTGDGYGMVGDAGVVGDWDGDGYDTIGVYRAGVLYPNDSEPKFTTSTTCTSFSISPTSASPSSSSGSTTVTLTGAPAGCTGGGWSAAGNGSWIGVSPASGAGAGSVTVSWQQNTGAPRSGSATIAGRSFTVSQGSVPVPSLTLDSPRDGDSLRAGSVHTIRWTSTDLTPSGSIQIFYTDSAGWQFVVSLPPSTTQHAWTVPATGAPITSVFVGSAVGSDWEASDASDVLITGPTELYTVTPCRAIDTRIAGQGAPAVAAGATRRFRVTGVCQVPTTARAVAANVTVTAPSTNGNVRFFPAGLPEPLVSVVNYAAGQTRANNAVLPIGTDGSVDLKCSQAAGTVDVVIDVVGYLQ
jgi:hypothetical protein